MSKQRNDRASLPASYARDGAPAVPAVPLGSWRHLYSSKPTRRRGHAYDSATNAVQVKPRLGMRRALYRQSSRTSNEIIRGVYPVLPSTALDSGPSTKAVL